MMTNIDLDTYLRNNGIMPSQQRLRIARVILDKSDIMSAEEIYRNVNGPWPPVSRATVNNTLRLFVEKGLLRKDDDSSKEIYYNSSSDSATGDEASASSV